MKNLVLHPDQELNEFTMNDKTLVKFASGVCREIVDGNISKEVFCSACHFAVTSAAATQNNIDKCKACQGCKASSIIYKHADKVIVNGKGETISIFEAKPVVSFQEFAMHL